MKSLSMLELLAVTDSTILGNTTSGGTNCAGTTVTTGTALTLDAPLVDASAGTKGTVYVFIGNDGESTPNSAVYQFATGFGEHTCGNRVTIGAGSTTTGVPVYSGSFDALYFAAATTGNLYVCGTAGGNAQLWRIPITTSSNMMGTPVGLTTSLSTAATTCSPVTEFKNGSVDQAYVSVEASGRPANCGGTGCVMSFTITTALAASATPSAVLPESGGTSGIVVDNASAFSGASQIYFSTLDRQYGDSGGAIRTISQLGGAVWKQPTTHLTASDANWSPVRCAPAMRCACGWQGAAWFRRCGPATNCGYAHSRPQSQWGGPRQWGGPPCPPRATCCCSCATDGSARIGWWTASITPAPRD